METVALAYITDPGQAPGDYQLVQEYVWDSRTDGTARTARATARRGDSRVGLRSSGDMATGRTRVRGGGVACEEGGGTLLGYTQFHPRFSVEGSGRVTVRLRYAFAWDYAGEAEAYGSIVYEDADQLKVVRTAGGSGAARRDVRLVIPVADGGSYLFSTYAGFFAEETGGASAFDYRSRLSVVASDGVEIRFDDPGFLSGERPAPVPLPTAGGGFSPRRWPGSRDCGGGSGDWPEDAGGYGVPGRT